jgi:hypothetical protein
LREASIDEQFHAGDVAGVVGGKKVPSYFFSWLIEVKMSR